MWTYINHHADQFFKNPFYLPAAAPGKYPRIPRIPSTNYFDLSVWKDLFLRYSPENPKYRGGTASSALAEDHRDSLMREQIQLNLTLTELLARS